MRPALPRLLVITTFPVQDSTAGALLLHRHLKQVADRYELHGIFVGPGTAGSFFPSTAIQPRPWFAGVHRLGRRLQRVAHALDAGLGLSIPRGPLESAVREIQPHAILTVADGAMGIRAWQVSRQLGRPLLVFLHDWHPGGVDAPSRLRGWISRRVRRMCEEAAASFSVCEEMREVSGGGPRAHVLYPISNPDSIPAEFRAPGDGETFQALFAGRFEHFLQDEMNALLKAAIAAGETRHLRLIGPSSGWRPEVQAAVTASGVYGGFLKGAALRSELEKASAQLVLAPFSRESEHIARYSFASKIPEYCNCARPIVIWGPEYASSVRWAARSGAALTVVDPRPEALLAGLRRLRADPALQEKLGSAAAREARTTFDPRRLQGIFEGALDETVGVRG